MKNTLSDVRQRIAALRSAKRLSRARFAEPLGIKDTMIQDLERLRQTPSPELLEKIQDVYRPNPQWFETGEGDMFEMPSLAEMREPDGPLQDFADRLRAANILVDQVLASSDLRPNRLLHEAMKTLVFTREITAEHLILLVSGIEEQIKQDRGQ